jgi:hypothetical protein
MFINAVISSLSLLSVASAVVVHEHWWNITWANSNPTGVSVCPEILPSMNGYQKKNMY